MEFKCPHCGKVIEIKYRLDQIQGGLELKFVILFGLCGYCKARIRLFFEIDDKTLKPTKIRTDVISDMDYVG